MSTATKTLTVFGLEIPASVHTLAGFRAWAAELPENAPLVHFYRGKVHIEVPQDFYRHEPVANAINPWLARLADDLDLGRYFMPPSWITDPASGLSTEPDGFLVRCESFESGRVRVNPSRSTELLGRPDMVLEVVSKSSAKKDLQDLVEGYAQAGVPEYWAVDPRPETPALRLLALTKGGAYRAARADADGFVASPTWGRSFRLRRFKNRAGLPDCRLETKR